MSHMVHIHASSYETCLVRDRKCAYGGDTKAIAKEPVIRPGGWKIELCCPKRGHFQVLERNLTQTE